MLSGLLSAGAEAGLLRVYQWAGGPLSFGLRPCQGRASLQLRQRRLESRATGGLHRVSGGGETIFAAAHLFVNSCLALVLLFRRKECAQGGGG